MKKSNLLIIVGIILFFSLICVNLFYLIKNNVYRKEDLILSEFNFKSDIEKLAVNSNASYEIFSSDENKVLIYSKNEVTEDEMIFNDHTLNIRILGEASKNTLYIEVHSKNLNEIENNSESYIIFKNDIKIDDEFLLSSRGSLVLEISKGEIKTFNIINGGDFSANSLDLKIDELNFHSNMRSSINFVEGKINYANLILSGGSNTVTLNMPNGILKGESKLGYNHIYINGPLKTNDFEIFNEGSELKVY